MRTTSMALIVTTLVGLSACTSDSAESPQPFLDNAGGLSADAGSGPALPGTPSIALDGGAVALKDASVATDASMTTALDAGKADAGPGLDAGATDAGATDAGATDAGATDAGATDAGATDAGATDAGATDAGATDAGATDAGATDAGATDAGTAGVCAGSTPHGCYKPKAGNPAGCPAQIHEQSAGYPPVDEWVACSSPYYVPCVYLRQDGTEANCSCDLGLHWLCSY